MRVVRGSDVAVGDRIYNRYGYCKWVEVVKVVPNGNNVQLHTRSFFTVVRRDEAVAIERPRANHNQTPTTP